MTFRTWLKSLFASKRRPTVAYICLLRDENGLYRADHTEENIEKALFWAEKDTLNRRIEQTSMTE